MKPLKLIDFPEIGRVESIFVLHFAPTIDQTSFEWWEIIDEASKAVFGITYDDTIMEEPSHLSEFDDDHPEVVAYLEKEDAHEILFRSDRILSHQEQMEYLIELGFDFSDNFGIRLKVTDHFFRQAVAVGNGLMGSRPDTTAIDTARWAKNVELEAKAFRSARPMKRSGQ